MYLKLEFMSAIVNDRRSCLYSWVGGEGGGVGGYHNSSLSAIVRNAYHRVNLPQSEM